jgi:hypothetical protein
MREREAFKMGFNFTMGAILALVVVFAVLLVVMFLLY